MVREIPRAPERKTVTVCIAAICDLPSDPKIISCSDSLMSGSLGKAQTRLKNRPLSKGFTIMTAGEDSEMNSVVGHVRREFRDAALAKSAFDEQLVVNLVRSALAKRKAEKAEEFAQSQFAISYEQLRKNGKQELPEDIFRQAMWDVREKEIEAEFIVHGFTDIGFPVIVKTEKNGKVGIYEDFAVIGEGGYLAHTVLMHRAYSEIMETAAAVYVVHEAKRYAEGAPSVGDHTLLTIAHADGRRQIMTPSGSSWAAAQYAAYGPKSIDGADFKLNDGAFADLPTVK